MDADGTDHPQSLNRIGYKSVSARRTCADPCAILVAQLSVAYLAVRLHDFARITRRRLRFGEGVALF